jgi:hypothetical protein
MAAASRCPDWPPAVDLVSGLVLGIGGATLQGLRSAGADCGTNPDGPNCRVHVPYLLPAMIAAASAAYGITAYTVCEYRLAHIERLTAASRR